MANFIAPAFVIAIISTLQAITVAKAIRADDEVMNPLRDIFSQGIQHIALAFLHGAPVANSINKSVAKKSLEPMLCKCCFLIGWNQCFQNEIPHQHFSPFLVGKKWEKGKIERSR